ncbi:hypothetical protein F7725_012574 [Dissostichus mawsoni]|uniref:Uncharacterized protein n=1 Tax=Dissostichus mawsoni TaxID=36200 RepID=A0A7J5YMP5_DISMA|nr:hypothetical protein F7725_012574 [Dissostichus mawsoni]
MVQIGGALALLSAADMEGNPVWLIDPASVRPSIKRGPSGPGWVEALVAVLGGGVIRDVVMVIKLIGSDA